MNIAKDDLSSNRDESHDEFDHYGYIQDDHNDTKTTTDDSNAHVDQWLPLNQWTQQMRSSWTYYIGNEHEHEHLDTLTPPPLTLLIIVYLISPFSLPIYNSAFCDSDISL